MHCAVISTAARCLADDAPLAAARARLRLADGRWVVAEAARLHGADSGVAVSIRAATTNDVLGLLVRAYSLTPRERELVTLLADGLDTRQLSHRLCISRYTVQQHLKSVFGKVGVRSRRELLTGVLAAHS
jgi:DNA-binding CsgD family transcriptional regulator